MFGGAGLLLRWARGPSGCSGSISMRRKPMPWAVLAAASMEENTRSLRALPLHDFGTRLAKGAPSVGGTLNPWGWGRSSPWRIPHVGHRLGLFFLHYQDPQSETSNRQLIVFSRLNPPQSI